MLFSYPPPYDQWYYLSNILTCKTCFKELAEEYFGKNEDQYQELMSEFINMDEFHDEQNEEINDDHPNHTWGWTYTEEELREIHQTHVVTLLSPSNR
jgi:hypothetical protein